jgi:uncharacterized protein YabE (DUF348 family)
VEDEERVRTKESEIRCWSTSEEAISASLSLQLSRAVTVTVNRGAAHRDVWLSLYLSHALLHSPLIFHIHSQAN